MRFYKSVEDPYVAIPAEACNTAGKSVHHHARVHAGREVLVEHDVELFGILSKRFKECQRKCLDCLLMHHCDQSLK